MAMSISSLMYLSFIFGFQYSFITVIEVMAIKVLCFAKVKELGKVSFCFICFIDQQSERLLLIIANFNTKVILITVRVSQTNQDYMNSTLDFIIIKYFFTINVTYLSHH